MSAVLRRARTLIVAERDEVETDREFLALYGTVLFYLDALIEASEKRAMHPAASLTGGEVPAHAPGAYPNLSCCGGETMLVPA